MTKNNNKILLTSIIAITTILGFSALDQQAHAAAPNFVISDDATGGDCVALGGIWTTGTKTCTSTNTIVIGTGESLTVETGVTLIMQGGAGSQSGQLDNGGGTIYNFGNIELIGGSGSQSGALDNRGNSSVVNNFGDMEFIGGSGSQSGALDNRGSVVNNFGDMEFIGVTSSSQTGALDNRSGLVTNNCGATITLNGGLGTSGSIDNRGGTINDSGTIILNGNSVILGNLPIDVLCSPEVITNLIDILDLPNNVANSLLGPLKQAQKILADDNPNNDQAGCDKILAFIDNVNAKEAANLLSASDASLLRNTGQTAFDDNGC